MHKTIQKKNFFWDESIWIGCIKLSLLRREYSSSLVNVLTNRVKTLHVFKSDFFQLNYLEVINEFGKAADVGLESLFRPVYHVACRRIL